MNRLAHKRMNAGRRAYRVSAKIHGTAERPRLAVNISNLNISAQLIDDDKGVTMAAATTAGKKLSGTMTDKAAAVGKEIAVTAKKAKVKSVVFDRGSRQYHGRVKALADAARQEGMEF
ncbi:MAG TPA: 50S ribosomal protein L18 [Candidatus Saccharimonadales bacterium]|nr:50S ribosomal protein L18 [Candidatus Saccharimonadales bacterium]